MHVWRLGVWAVSSVLAILAGLVGFGAIYLRELGPDDYAMHACTGHASAETYAYGQCVDTHLRDGFWVPGQWPLIGAVGLFLVGLGFLLSWLHSRRSADA